MNTRPCPRCNGTGREADPKALGAAIKRAREQQDIGVRQLARMAGCSPAYVVVVEENGGSPAGAKVRSMLKVLGLKPEDMT